MKNNLSTLSEWLKASESLKLLETIDKLCDKLINALNVSFEKVSWFAKQIRSWVIQWDLFVDKIVFNLIKLKFLVLDMAKQIEKKTNVINQKYISFLYDIEWEIINTLNKHTFLYNTFWRMIQWILNTIKYIRYNIVIN